jgi:hypothetical protein
MLAASTPLDARQDQLMTNTSSDGRPPPRWLRLTEWRWSAVAAILILAGITTWVAFNGVALATALATLAFAVLLLVGASPVLAAGNASKIEQQLRPKP